MRKSIFIIATIFFNQIGQSQSCLPDGIQLTTQERIDNFSLNFPNCTMIEGGIYIAGNNISNLLGLSGITAIGGGLGVNQTTMLVNLNGLENLTSIGGIVFIEDNDALTSLSGLDNVTSFGAAIGGGVLWLYGNPLLTECSISSVCKYIMTSDSIGIQFNAPGCNTVAEVESQCNQNAVSSFRTLSEITLSPNPNQDAFTVELPEPAKSCTTFRITDHTGRLVLEQNVEPTVDQKTVQSGDLPSGLYHLQVVSNGKIQAVEKFVKQ